jgi:hypothetical protein
MEEENYFKRLNPDTIGKITSLLQPKDVAKWKQTGKSMKQMIESNYNLEPNTVNVYRFVDKNTTYETLQYKSKDLEFKFIIDVNTFDFKKNVVNFLNAITNKKDGSLLLVLREINEFGNYNTPEAYFKKKNGMHFTLKEGINNGYARYTYTVELIYNSKLDRIEMVFYIHLGDWNKSPRKDRNRILFELGTFYMNPYTWIPTLEEFLILIEDEDKMEVDSESEDNSSDSSSESSSESSDTNPSDSEDDSNDYFSMLKGYI